MDIGAYQKMERPFVVTIAGENDTELSLRGSYRVSEVWKQSEDQTLLGWLERVVCSWDLTNGGEPVPLTREGLEGLGDEALPLLRAVETVIREDTTYPNLRKAKTA